MQPDTQATTHTITHSSTPADDRRFMGEAIRWSRQHTGLTDTNPSVGCVIVRDGEIVGAAVTAIGGRPHAETQALALAGEKARGATAYVTLEPCAHWGRTPPCANALVDAGVARVVIAVADPDPRVAGQGVKILRDAGITVETGLLEREARRPLAGYLMRQTNHRPYVTLKLAVSADGMLGRRGEEIAITGEATRTIVHHLRAESDAILVGIGTVLSDDPELTVRLPGLEERSPVRIVLDRTGRLPQSSRLVTTAAQVPVIVAAVGDGVDCSQGALPADTSEETDLAAGSRNAVPTARPETMVPSSGLEATFPSKEEVDDAHDHSVSCRCGDEPVSAQGADVDVSRNASPPPVTTLQGQMPRRAEENNSGTAAEAGNAENTSEAVTQLCAETLDALLRILATRGLSTLLVEGGATVAKAFLEAGLVDRVLLFASPVVVGKGGLESPLRPSDMPKEFTLVGQQPFGRDRAYEYERSA